MKPRLRAVHPVLMCSDVGASLRFFERLGFRELFRDEPVETRYACVSRDGVEIHLQWHGPEQWQHAGDLPAYRFLVSEVDALYAELRSRDALPDLARAESPWSAPGDTPWGTREFHLRDPDGNCLHFYQAANAAPQVLLREAAAADVPALAAIRAREWGIEEAWRERIVGYLAGTANPRDALPPRTVVVALRDETPVGFAAGHLTRRFGCDGELQWVNVAAAARGTGVASLLLRRLAEWFVAHGATRVCVNVEPENEAGRRFYLRHHAEPLASHWLVWEDVSAVLDRPSLAG